MIKAITRDDLKKRMDSREEKFTLIDARSSKSYNKEHIKGAKSLPVKEFDKERVLKQYDTHEEIIVYCGNLNWDASSNVASWLQDLGYLKVLEFKEGIDYWKEAWFPTEQ